MIQKIHSGKQPLTRKIEAASCWKSKHVKASVRAETTGPLQLTAKHLMKTGKKFFTHREAKQVKHQAIPNPAIYEININILGELLGNILKSR